MRVSPIEVPGNVPLNVQVQAQQQGYLVKVLSERARWRGVFEALDAAGEALSSEPVRIADESDAIVAACLRYGSYFHLLTCGLSHRWSKNESRITDSEMRCINVEYSAALAQWWRDKEQDPARVNRRVRAALLLPAGWHDNRDEMYRTYPDMDTYEVSPQEQALVARLEELRAVNERYPESAMAFDKFTELDLRMEANITVQMAWRNGPIDDFHQGRSMSGTWLPGYRRFSAQEVNDLMYEAADSLFLHVRQHNNRDRRVQGVLVEFNPAQPNWSLTEETVAVDYQNKLRGHVVRAHLKRVGDVCPGLYAEVSNAGDTF